MQENVLRIAVRQIIIENAGEELEKTLNQVFDAAEEVDILDDIFDDVNDLVDDAIENPEEFKKSVQENIGLSKTRLNEGGVILGLGIAAAAPIIMKGIGKLTKAISKGLSAVDSITGAEENWKSQGEKWEQWWSGKSEELHHAYIGVIKKIVKSIGRLPGVTIDDNQTKKIAEGIWTLIVAFLMIKSGAGIIAAVGKASYGIAGLEGALTAIKAGEIGVYISDLFAIVT